MFCLMFPNPGRCFVCTFPITDVALSWTHMLLDLLLIDIDPTLVYKLYLTSVVLQIVN